MTRVLRGMPPSLSVAVLACATLAVCVLPTAHAAPHLYAAPSSWLEDSLCATATENRHEVADSKGGVCSPLVLDATTGCCLEPKTTVSAEQCQNDCSDKDCCDGYARCVVCCNEDVKAKAKTKEELPPVSHMHPSMWRSWLIRNAVNNGGHGREQVRGESHPFPPGQDDYTIEPFAYCKHRCRTSGESTKYENEYQNEKHHCFGSFGVESVGAEDTLSPGRETQKLHDEAGDFKLESGVSKELGLAKTIGRPSDGKGETKKSLFENLTGKRSVLSSYSNRNGMESGFARLAVSAVEAIGVVGVGVLVTRRWRKRRATGVGKTC